jgi:hypothetical protein
MLPRRSPWLEEGTRAAGGNRANWFPGGPGSKRHIPSEAGERDFPESGKYPFFGSPQEGPVQIFIGMRT